MDTAIIVDLLRDHPPALTWIANQPDLGLSSIVWLEAVDGATNRRSQREAIELLRRFERIDPIPEDYDWAIQQCLKFKLSHNVGMMDCLIASASHRFGKPLYSPNLKHFQPILGNLAVKPY